MNEDKIFKIIIDLAQQFDQKIEKIREEMSKTESCPEVRMRTFIIRGHGNRFLKWPCNDNGTITWYKNERGAFVTISEKKTLKSLCQQDMRACLRVLRQFQAMNAWADKRLDGLRRAKSEINNQQHKYIESLEAEAAIWRMSK